MAATRPAVIRLPLALRVYIVVFMCIWCGMAVAAAIGAARDNSPAVLVVAEMFVFGLTLSCRIFRVSVQMCPNELVVRNHFRTRRVTRDEIEQFRVGPLSMDPFLWTIYVLMRDGTLLPIDVAARPYRGARGRAVLAKRMNQMREWLDRP